MANSFFYTEADGNKQGPLTPEQLQALANRGIVKPDTILTTENGKQGKAGQIKGLFNSATPSPFTQPAQVAQSVAVPVVVGNMDSFGGTVTSTMKSMMNWVASMVAFVLTLSLCGFVAWIMWWLWLMTSDSKVSPVVAPAGQVAEAEQAPPIDKAQEVENKPKEPVQIAAPNRPPQAKAPEAEDKPKEPAQVVAPKPQPQANVPVVADKPNAPLIADTLEKEINSLKNYLEVSQKRLSDYRTEEQLKGRSFDRYAALGTSSMTQSGLNNAYQQYTRARQQAENEAKVIERLKKQIDELETKLNAQRLADLKNNVPSRPLSTANLPTEQEKALLRRKIDLANRGTDGKLSVELTDEEKEGIVLYLFVAEKALKEKYSEAGLSLLLMKLSTYKSLGRSGSADIVSKGGLTFPKIDKVDAYIACWAGHDTTHTNSNNLDVYRLQEKNRAIIYSLLPECNRLSGNANDDKEKTRLENKQREAESKQLFGK